MKSPAALWPFFVTPPQQGDDDLLLASAHGVRLRLADGRTLLDGTSGLWNTNLGYGNEAIADASAAALRDASYLNTFRFENVYARRAAEALVAATGGRFARVLFSTSGSAANDLVMKLARHYQVLRGQEQRQLVVGLTGSYHGLTYGSFALTGEELGQRVYGVDRRLVRHVPLNDTDALEALLARQGDRIAAVVVEPLLGSGAIPLTDEFLTALTAAREEHGFLLVADEVATGFGRTGTLFASERWPGAPDVLLTSKGMTNGTCAASAVLVSDAVAREFHGRGAMLVHGETQAGTPVAAAAVTATLAEMARLDAVVAGRRVASALDIGLADLEASVPAVAGSRGTGCFRAVVVRDGDGEPLASDRIGDLVAAVRRAGAVVHPGIDGVQLVPALTSTTSDIDELFGALRCGLDELAAQATEGMPASGGAPLGSTTPMHTERRK